MSRWRPVLMARLGLEVNTTKTRIARLPEEQFDFPATRSVASTARTGALFRHPAVAEGGEELAQVRIHERTTPSVVSGRTSPCRWCSISSTSCAAGAATSTRNPRSWKSMSLFDIHGTAVRLVMRRAEDEGVVPPDPERVSLRDA